MKTERIDLYGEGEYTYPVKGSFRPFVMAYRHEDKASHRPLIVVPGGAYRIVSPTEGEIVAKAFYEDGFDTFVLVYTCNLLFDHPLLTQAEDDLARAAALFPEPVSVIGFSAGGHLAASCAVHGKARFRGMVLGYPVITMGEAAHADTRRALLGAAPSEEQVRYFSLETQVTDDTPPCFLWYTKTDEAVPPGNSELFASAMRAKNRPVEVLSFPRGIHGMSLANAVWADSDPYPGMYAATQQMEDVSWCIVRKKPLPERYESLNPAKDIASEFQRLQVLRNKRHHADPLVASWKKQASRFLLSL